VGSHATRRVSASGTGCVEVSRDLGVQERVRGWFVWMTLGMVVVRRQGARIVGVCVFGR
jgi:hypothetical protein